MSNQTNNQNVNEYLNKPPHWLVSHGILLILLLIITFTISSLFIKVSEPEQVILSMDLAPYEKGLRVQGSDKFVSLIAESGELVNKNSPLMDVIQVPSNKDLATSGKNPPSHQSESRTNVLVRYNTLLSSVEGVFYYDSIRSTGIVIPEGTQISGKIRIDSSIEKRIKHTDQLSFTFDNGHKLSINTFEREKVSEEHSLLFISFLLPYTLTENEVINNSLSLHLDIEKNLFASIMEKL